MRGSGGYNLVSLRISLFREKGGFGYGSRVVKARIELYCGIGICKRWWGMDMGMGACSRYM